MNFELLNMHYEDRITGELFDDEQTHLRHQREDAEALITRLNLSYQDIAETLDLALEILGEDLHDLYQRADDTVRRLLNQAIFNALFVCDETITKAELAGPFAELRDFHNALRGIVSATPNPTPATIVASTAPQNAKTPVPRRERGSLDVGSISNVLVDASGPRLNRRARVEALRRALAAVTDLKSSGCSMPLLRSSFRALSPRSNPRPSLARRGRPARAGDGHLAAPHTGRRQPVVPSAHARRRAARGSFSRGYSPWRIWSRGPPGLAAPLMAARV
jgi:hypothetical protein